MYFGLHFYLYAQESKKEDLKTTETSLTESPSPAQSVTENKPDEFLADYSGSVDSGSQAKETSAEAEEIPAEATADYTEKLTPAQELEPAKKKAPAEGIVVNGDKVEYSADAKEVSAEGDVDVVYKGSKLSCQKIIMNTFTKEGRAEGNVRLDDPKGTISGSKITYNFQNKTGTITDAGFMSYPYFGKARKLEKVSDNEFIILGAKVTTCSYDHPHYNLKAKKIDFFQGDKLQGKDVSFFVGNIPFLYLPSFSRSFKDPLMHLQVTPGSRNEWGKFLLNRWRTNLTDTLSARVYLDYRTKLGFAEGGGLNYNSPDYGKADLKFYYTDEKPESVPAGAPGDFQRYLVRWRQKWDIDERTNLISEFYKIKDEKWKNRNFFSETPDFLKDYFYREFEKDEQPLTYALFHHAFANSIFDFLAQPRVNHWYNQLEKLPEARYTLPSFKIGATPIYFESNTSIGNYDKKAATPPVTPQQESVSRLDSQSRILLPLKLAFLELTPFAGGRETVYDKGADGSSLPVRSIFYGGLNLSSRFYRLYDINTKFFGMEINGLRHIIAPTIAYSYNNDPSVSADELRHIDDVDFIEEGNRVEFGLSNKLQTKRNGKSVDLLDFLVTSSYEFKPREIGGEKHGGKMEDVYFKLKILPFAWMRLESDAIYSTVNDCFSEVNYDIILDFAKGRSFGIGQRYDKNGANQVTSSLNWRFNPKWRFYAYDRIEFGDDKNLVRGLAEQQYVLSRDLHCWEVGLAYNRKKDEGSTVWLIFKLKAFPGMEFNFDQLYHKPESGSQ